jgi:hypothetical protein
MRKDQSLNVVGGATYLSGKVDSIANALGAPILDQEAYGGVGKRVGSVLRSSA